MVLKGEADALLGMSISEERRQVFDFTDPTFTREFVFVVRSRGR
jgi:ABC-type amino acid transport substrate-binding protein